MIDVDGRGSLAGFTEKAVQVVEGQTGYLTREKVKRLLRNPGFFPDGCRESVWRQILRLPSHMEEFKRLKEMGSLPRTKELVQDYDNSRTIGIVFDALVHWHASLINCEWIVPLLSKISTISRKPLFMFEVTMVLLSNWFGDWLSELPGPPPAVIARMDATLSMINPRLGQKLKSGLALWTPYRSFFAETLFERPWRCLMDNVVCEPPNFIEYLVIAYMDINAVSIIEDEQSFNSTHRAILIGDLLKRAREIYQPFGRHFQPIVEYPIYDADAESVAFRSAQTEQDKIKALRTELERQKEETLMAAAVAKRKDETFAQIQEMRKSVDHQHKIEASDESNDLNDIVKKLQLERQMIKLREERQFIDRWKQEWDTSAIPFQSQLIPPPSSEPLPPKSHLFDDMRELDIMRLQNDRTLITRSRHVNNELKAHAIHERDRQQFKAATAS